MQQAKRAFLALAVLILLGTGGFILYHAAYLAGDIAGYNSGYSSGHEVGYSSGEQDGYVSGKVDGYASGKVDGYTAGKEDGYSSGKQDGYIAGKTAGYTEGYDQGTQAGLGHGYTIKDSTYEQVLAFLSHDKTSDNKYVEPAYVCSHFARDVCNNAEAQGLRCAFVELRYSGSGHSIVAFNAIDKGLVYFEPQSDEIVKPVVGKRFYQCVEPRPGYYYPSPAYDDTIRDILVIW